MIPQQQERAADAGGLAGFVPAMIIGCWSGLLWHRYVVELGVTLGAWTDTGMMACSSTFAIAAAAFGITRMLTRKRVVPLAAAWIERPLARFGARSLAVFAIISMLVVLDHEITSASPPPEHACSDCTGYEMPPPPEDIVYEVDAGPRCRVGERRRERAAH